MPIITGIDNEIRGQPVFAAKSGSIQKKTAISRVYRLRHLLLASLCLAHLGPLAAFDYLEHSLVTDRACYEAQKMLARDLAGAPTEQKSRYLALALMCPTRWQSAYCENKRKTVRAAFSAGAAKNGGHPITLGDYSALVDHVTEYGRVQNLPGAAELGLTDFTWQWMHPQKASGGIASDIGSEQCSDDKTPDWYKVEADISSFFHFWQKEKRAPRIPSAMLDENRRGDVSPGPADPSTLFTIRNPRFLDLQLFNQTHFGTAAYRTWAGMHNTALAIASERCEDVVEPEESAMRRLAEGRANFSGINWSKKKNLHFRRDACRLLSTVAREHLQSWIESGDERLTTPARQLVAAVLSAKNGSEGAAIADMLPAHLAALVFEGAGAHYLQDALSGGHVRTEHRSRELNNTRRYHDLDSKSGVVATLGARHNRHDFVAYGDTFLLGSAAMSLLDTDLQRCENATKKNRQRKTTHD